jgi:hypothetical protein
LLSDYTATAEGERALQSADTVLLLRQAPGRGSALLQARYGLSSGDRLWLGVPPRPGRAADAEGGGAYPRHALAVGTGAHGRSADPGRLTIA